MIEICQAPGVYLLTLGLHSQFSTVHIAGGGAVPAGGGCSDAARAGGDQGVAEVGAEAGRGAQERLQRGQEEQLPDQELELSTGLRGIL